MDENEYVLNEFTRITGIDNDRAKFYLESSAWDLEAALSSFYDEDAEPSESHSAETEASSKTASKPPDHSRFNMIDADSDSSDEGQAFYAGGSEHSGQQVLGPSKRRDDLVSKLFKSAKEHGAEVLDSSKKVTRQNEKLTFSGTGYRLGVGDSDTEVVPGASCAGKDTPREFTLKMWKAGFTVDNGPLREYDDPANEQFLSCIKRSEIPTELIKEARGREVFINMADHRHDDYVAPKKKVMPFSGVGHALGSPAPSLLGKPKVPAASDAAPGDLKNFEEEAKKELATNSSEPTTNIQVRLLDGTRLVLCVNHTHTIQAIRNYIERARPQYSNQSYTLMTTLPHAELEDCDMTVKEAKLLNTAIVMKGK